MLRERSNVHQQRRIWCMSCLAFVIGRGERFLSFLWFDFIASPCTLIYNKCSWRLLRDRDNSGLSPATGIIFDQFRMERRVARGCHIILCPMNLLLLTLEDLRRDPVPERRGKGDRGSWCWSTRCGNTHGF